MPRNDSERSRKDKRVPRARVLRREMTEAERRLWWHLRALKFGGGHFRRQAPIGPYFADFACHQARLVIELDGSEHMDRHVVASDRRRTRYLESQGYRVLRFWNTDVLTNSEGVMTVVADALAATVAPYPLPLPAMRKRARGEGNASNRD